MFFSGVNHGDNAAYAVAYSGTFGAAFEACLHEIKSISLSQLKDKHGDINFDLLHEFMPEILDTLLSSDWLSETTININFPACTVKECKGIEIAPYKKRNIIGKVICSEDEDGHTYLYTQCHKNFEEGDLSTDVNVLGINKIAITPVSSDWNNMEHVSLLKEAFSH